MRGRKRKDACLLYEADTDQTFINDPRLFHRSAGSARPRHPSFPFFSFALGNHPHCPYNMCSDGGLHLGWGSSKLLSILFPPSPFSLDSELELELENNSIEYDENSVYGFQNKLYRGEWLQARPRISIDMHQHLREMWKSVMILQPEAEAT